VAVTILGEPNNPKRGVCPVATNSPNCCPLAAMEGALLFDLVPCNCPSSSGQCFLQGVFNSAAGPEWYLGSRPGLFVRSGETAADKKEVMNTAQNYTFSVVNVSVVQSVYSADELFSSNGWPTLGTDGVLHFETARGTAGEFLLTIQMRDSGGTALGGVDTTRRIIALKVAPRLLVPSLLPVPGGPLVLPEASEPQVHTFPALLAGMVPWSRGDVLRGPPELVYEVLYISDPALFTLPVPSVSANGTLTFTLAPFKSGNATLVVRLAVLNAGGSVKGTGNATEVLVSVQSSNQEPRFSVAERFDLVETAEGALSHRRAVLGAVWGITAGSPEEDATQSVTFRVELASSPAVAGSSSVLLLNSVPEIDPGGTLEFHSAFGQHGEVVLLVQAFDSGQPDSDGRPRSSPVVRTVLRLWPRPRVISVAPKLAPLEGGGRLTVWGAFFGSIYSRGASLPPSGVGYGNVSVSVGGAQCGGVVVASDAELLCNLPRGRGSSLVSVTVTDGALTRDGSLDGALFFNLLYAGGWEGGTGRRGILASSPADANVERMSVRVGGRFSAGVRALASLGGALFVGGSFIAVAAAVRPAPLGHVAVWDGAVARGLGGGVDGDVYALAPWAGPEGSGFGVIVGGAFTTAFAPSAPALRCGGLAWWNITGSDPAAGLGSWTMAGMFGPLDGVVWTIAVGPRAAGGGAQPLLVGGHFDLLDGATGFGGLAQYSASGSWAPVGTGLSGQVSAIALGGGGGAGGAVYVAGDLRLVGPDGGAARGGVAGFDGAQWSLLPALDGPVHSLAVVGDAVLAAGAFRKAVGQPASLLALGGVARFYGGGWAGVGGGLSGTVFSVAAAEGCLYAGGPGQMARICQAGPEAAVFDGGSWESLLGSGGIGVVRTIVPALAAGVPASETTAFQCSAGSSDGLGGVCAA
jgi:hypothetical protein